jgi:hypothetical protein
MDGKRASLLHEFVPAARRIAILTGRPPRHAEGAEEAQRLMSERIKMSDTPAASLLKDDLYPTVAPAPSIVLVCIKLMLAQM